MAPKVHPLETKFWKRVKKGPANQCWPISNATKNTPYGHIRHGRKSTLRGNRASWIIHFGEVPDGMCVLHKCDNPACVNPRHLFLGTK